MSAPQYTAGVTIETADTPALTDRGDGSLGCFVQTPNDRPALLSCSHVLFPGFQAPGDIDVYSPSYTTCCAGDPMARWTRGNADASKFDAHGWKGGFDTKLGIGQIPSPSPSGYKEDPNVLCSRTDCGIAELRSGVAFHNVWKTSEGDIPLAGAEPSFEVIKERGIAVAGQQPAAQHYVRVYSPRSKRLIWGTLLWTKTEHFTDGSIGTEDSPIRKTPTFPKGISDVTKEADDRAGALPNIDQFLILPRPKPLGTAHYEDDYAAAGAMVGFQRGDSGSVVIDHDNKVIAMIVRGLEFDPSRFVEDENERKLKEFVAATGLRMGVASPIAYILDHLKITIPAHANGWSAVAPNRGPVVRVFIPGVHDDADFDAHRHGLACLRAGLEQSRRGKLVIGLIARHRRELRWLFARVRAIGAAWRALQGPAFYHHGVRSVRDREHVVPFAINGVTRKQLCEGLLPLVALHGSARLRRDLHSYGPWALDVFLPLRSVHDVPAAVAPKWTPP